MNEKPSADAQPGKRARLGLSGIFRRILFVVVCLITLIAILYAEEDWRGKHAWDQFKQEWEAKGEKFDLQSFIPPTVPDDQNFAMTPFLAPLFDYNPRMLATGQSVYKDTNAYNRVLGFANDLPSPESSNMWAKSQPVDLQAYAIGFQPRAKGPPLDAASLTRADAAQIVLKALEKYRPVLDEIQTASRRPYSRFNINYANEFPAAILIPHLAVMKQMSQMFLLRASAELALGQTDASFADVKMGLFLSGTMKGEPFLISGLVRIAILQIAVPHIWEGLASHRWTDAQLAEFETNLGSIDLLAEYETQMRGERSLGNGVMDYLRNHRRVINDAVSDESTGRSQSSYALYSIVPAGWFYQNELVINRMHQEFLLPPVDAANHRVYVDKVSSIGTALTNELSGGFPPYKIFAKLLLPALDKSIIKYAYAQENVDLATVACALERSRLANGKYPETLAELAPKFIATVPNDVISGEPLKYHRTDDGQFLLYSVGWNGTDDGGQTAMTTDSTPRADNKQGDWVWPAYPAKGF